MRGRWNGRRRRSSDQRHHLTHGALHGWEIVDSAARLCVMNLYLHGIGANGNASPIRVEDSLAADPGDRFDMVLTNPPFGKKSSVTYITDTGETKRDLHEMRGIICRPLRLPGGGEDTEPDA